MSQKLAVRLNQSSGIYYGWIIVGLGFVTLAFLIVSRFSFAIFQKPLIEEFGWSRGVLGGAFALGLFVYAISAPYFGSLLERKGPRAIMPWGCVVVGFAMIGGYFISSIWHVYLFIGLIAGIGITMNGFATNTAIMPRWFLHKRGRATGITLSGIGCGILVLSPIIARMIDHFGWRISYLLFGLFILVVIAPTSFLLMQNRPEELGQGRDGLPPSATEKTAGSISPHSPNGEVDMRVRSVFLTLRGNFKFWAILFVYFSIGFNNNTILTQLHLYLVDSEYTTTAAASIFGMVGFLRTVGSVLGGRMADFVGRGRGAALSAMTICCGLLLLILLPKLGGGLTLGYLFTLIYGLGLGSMSVCASSLSGDIFEGPTYGVIVGFVEICYGLGGVVGPPLAGVIFDLTGSYIIPFSLIITILLISIFVSLWLQRQVNLPKETATP